MKKSIVLLISLFFISAVSVLILKNLEDTDSYISKQNSKFTKTQMLLLIDNVKEEVSSAIGASNGDGVKKDYLSDYYGINFPLKIKDIDIIFILKPYQKENINLLKEIDAERYKDLSDLFLDNNIYDFDYFMEIYKEKRERYLKMDNQDINSYKQIDDIFDEFIKRTYNDSILILKDKIGFFDYNQDKAEKEKKYDYYELMVKINFLKEFVKARYILNKEGKVEDFEFSFK
jgi:hypothetical protein